MIMTYEQIFSQLPDMYGQSFMIGIVLGCLFAAFFGCRFFKASLMIGAGFIGFSLGSSGLSLILGDAISEGTALVLGIACALLFALIIVKLYKVCIKLAQKKTSFQHSVPQALLEM